MLLWLTPKDMGCGLSPPDCHSECVCAAMRGHPYWFCLTILGRESNVRNTRATIVAPGSLWVEFCFQGGSGNAD